MRLWAAAATLLGSLRGAERGGRGRVGGGHPLRQVVPREGPGSLRDPEQGGQTGWGTGGYGYYLHIHAYLHFPKAAMAGWGGGSPLHTNI